MGEDAVIDNDGRLAAIIRYPAKGVPGVPVAEALLQEGIGLEGDRHAGGGDRQLSLFSVEQREWIKGQEEAGLCFSRFKENVTTQGLALDTLRQGTRLVLGAAVLEITGETKHCHTECPLYREKKPCPLAGQSLFAKVTQSGVIRVGDAVRPLN
jgi:MOSC domain-containing protein YiiM